jgi:hypothetical protein
MMSLRPPLFMILHILPSASHRKLRLWMPLLLIWVLLLPFLLALLPVYFVTCAVLDLRPFKTLGAFFMVLASLGGTHLEVCTPRASVFVHIY